MCLDGLCICLDTVFLSGWIVNQTVYFALVVIYIIVLYRGGGILFKNYFIFVFIFIKTANV